MTHANFVRVSLYSGSNGPAFSVEALDRVAQALGDERGVFTMPRFRLAAELEHRGLTVLSGVMEARHRGFFSLKIAFDSVMELDRSGVPKRRHVKVERRCTALPAGRETHYFAIGRPNSPAPPRNG